MEEVKELSLHYSSVDNFPFSDMFLLHYFVEFWDFELVREEVQP